MLSERMLQRKAADELIRVFGREYLQKNYENTCRAWGYLPDSRYMFFVGIKDEDDLPDRKANEKGWVVYGTLILDATSGEVIQFDYVLE